MSSRPNPEGEGVRQSISGDFNTAIGNANTVSIGSGFAFCHCGDMAAGVCTECDKVVCTRHSRNRGRRLCSDCERQDQARQEREAQARAAARKLRKEGEHIRLMNLTYENVFDLRSVDFRDLGEYRLFTNELVGSHFASAISKYQEPLDLGQMLVQKQASKGPRLRPTNHRLQGWSFPVNRGSAYLSGQRTPIPRYSIYAVSCDGKFHISSDNIPPGYYKHRGGCWLGAYEGYSGQDFWEPTAEIDYAFAPLGGQDTILSYVKADMAERMKHSIVEASWK